MSFHRDKSLPLNSVCISGATGKSEVFKAAAFAFGLHDINNDYFYYITDTSNGCIQTHVINLVDLDSPHAFDLSTRYREATCIVLVYDSTDKTSLELVCNHYRHVIHRRFNARVVLLRNNQHIMERKISVKDEDEYQSCVTAELHDTLQYSINGNMQYHSFSILTPSSSNTVSTEISNFFQHELVNICDKKQSHSVTLASPKCCCCSYFCCCCCGKCPCCRPKEENDSLITKRVL